MTPAPPRRPRPRPPPPTPAAPEGAGRPGREGRSHGVRRGRRAGQQVLDLVEERLHQGFGVGQLERCPPGERDRVRLGGHGRGDGPYRRDVVGVDRPGTPGVVVPGCQSGQQPAPRGEVQSVQRRRAPAAGRGVGGGIVAGPDQQRQRVGEGEENGGHGVAAYGSAPAPVPPYDRDLRGCLGQCGGFGGCGGVGQRAALGVPEGDPAFARQLGGEEDRGASSRACHRFTPRPAHPASRSPRPSLSTCESTGGV